MRFLTLGLLLVASTLAVAQPVFQIAPEIAYGSNRDVSKVVIDRFGTAHYIATEIDSNKNLWFTPIHQRWDGSFYAPSSSTPGQADSVVITDLEACADGGVLMSYSRRLEPQPDVEQEWHWLWRIGPTGSVDWAHEFDTKVEDIEVAKDGSVFVATNPSSVEEETTTRTGRVYKYSQVGVLQWTQDLEGAWGRQHFLKRLVSDGEGGVWGTGTYGDPEGLFVARFNTPGLTAIPFVDTNLAEGELIACDPWGNVFVLMSNPTKSRVFVNRYGADGNLHWSKSTAMFHATTMAVDGSGNLVVAGDIKPVTGSTPYAEACVAKFNGSDGSVLFKKRFNRPGSTDNAFSHLKLEGPGNIIVSGFSATADSAEDAVLVKYNPSGALGWPHLPNGAFVGAQPGASRDFGMAIGRDPAGRLYMATEVSQSSKYVSPAIKLFRYGPQFDATFASQMVPLKMVAGQSYLVTVEFTNRGPEAWSKAGNYGMIPVYNLWGVERVPLAGAESSPTDQARKTSFYVYAPTEGGSYDFQWFMDKTGVGPFGFASDKRTVQVEVKPNAARFVSQTVPTQVQVSSQFNVQVRMRNVGTVSWTKSRGFTLRPEPGQPDWGVAQVTLETGETIAPGQEKLFSFTCTAPSSAGTYTMKWRMYRESAGVSTFFGDKTLTKSIKVTSLRL